MKQVKVGTFKFCFSNVDVYAREGTGGDFFVFPDATNPPRIKIGVDYPDAWLVFHVLLHEALEFALSHYKARFEPCSKFNNGSELFLFSFDHATLTQVCAEVGFFMHRAWPKLDQVYRRWNAKPLDKSRRSRKRRRD